MKQVLKNLGEDENPSPFVAVAVVVQLTGKLTDQVTGHNDERPPDIEVVSEAKTGKAITTLQDVETKATEILETINGTIELQEGEEARLQVSHDDAINDAKLKLSQGNNTAATRFMKNAKLYKLKQDKVGRAIDHMMNIQIIQVESTLNSARVIGKMKPAAQSSQQSTSSDSSSHKSMDTIMKELHDSDYYAQQVQQILSETVQVQESERDLLLELQDIMASESISSRPPATVPYSAASHQVPSAPSMDPNDVVVEAELV